METISSLHQLQMVAPPQQLESVVAVDAPKEDVELSQMEDLMGDLNLF